jgi:tetratricopeptide (TPR) repeat protein
VSQIVLVIVAAASFLASQEPASRPASESDQALAEIEKLIEKDPENYDAILAAINSALPKLDGFPKKKAKAHSYLFDWTSRRDNALSKKAHENLIEGLEKDVEDPANAKAVAARLDDARRAAAALGNDWRIRVQGLASKVAMAALRAPIDAARAKEEAGDLKGALVGYDFAIALFHKEFDKLNGTGSAEMVRLFKELVTASDGLVERVETQAFEDSIPVRDLLSKQEREGWGKSAGAELEFQGGTPGGTASAPAQTLVISGVDTGRRLIGVASVLPAKEAPWKDLVLDYEFTIRSGDFELYVRYWPDKASYRIRFDPRDGYDVGKRYQGRIKIKGSTISLKTPDQPENRDQFGLSTSRTGGIALGVSQGSKVEFTRFELKVLR